MKVEIQLDIVLPPCSQDRISNGLRELTRVLCNGEGGGFGLGGEFGYGVDYENDTFLMHPYCWCEQEECPWCTGLSPNFWHKPSNTRISWYKYIGRGMKLCPRKITEQQWSDVLASCVASIAAQPASAGREREGR